MNTYSIFRTSLLTAIALLFLSACGGGGDGDNNDDIDNKDIDNGGGKPDPRAHLAGV